MNKKELQIIESKLKFNYKIIRKQLEIINI